jgi:hypothetical protein
MEYEMGLLRVIALGTAAAFAWKLWKEKQATSAPAARASRDTRDITPPHGDALSDVASYGAEASVPASQSSRGFGAV